MSESSISPETLAAFLDGTLSSEDRERVLATLARSDEAYGDFVEAVAIAKALDAAEQPAVRPSRTPSRWRRTLLMAIPAVSGAGVLFLVTNRWPAGDVDGMTRVVRSPLAGAGATSAASTVWSDSRGAAAELRPSARLFRMGVRLAELEAAYSSGDAAAIDSAFAALQDAASGTTDGRLEVLALQTGNRTARPANRNALAARLRGAEPDTWHGWFDMGAWCASARLAAAARQVRFFQTDGDALVALNRLLDAEQRLAPAQRQQAPEALTAALRAFASRPIESEAQLIGAAPLLQQALLAGSR